MRKFDRMPVCAHLALSAFGQSILNGADASFPKT